MERNDIDVRLVDYAPEYEGIKKEEAEGDDR